MLKLHFGVKPAKLDAPDQFKGRGVGNHVLAHGFSVSETALQREVFIDRRPAGNIMRGSDNLQTCSHGKCRDEAQIGARGVARLPEAPRRSSRHIVVSCKSLVASTATGDGLVQLVKSGGLADEKLLTEAWNAIGDYYSDRQRWTEAANFYRQGGSQEPRPGMGPF